MGQRNQVTGPDDRTMSHMLARAGLAVAMLSAVIAFGQLLVEGWPGVLAGGVIALGLGVAVVLGSRMSRRGLALALVPIILGSAGVTLAAGRLLASGRTPVDVAECRPEARFTTIVDDQVVSSRTPVRVRATMCPGVAIWVVKHAYNEYHLHCTNVVQPARDGATWSAPFDAVTCKGRHCPKNFNFVLVATDVPATAIV